MQQLISDLLKIFHKVGLLAFGLCWTVLVAIGPGVLVLGGAGDQVMNDGLLCVCFVCCDMFYCTFLYCSVRCCVFFIQCCVLPCCALLYFVVCCCLCVSD